MTERPHIPCCTSGIDDQGGRRDRYISGRKVLAQGLSRSNVCISLVPIRRVRMFRPRAVKSLLTESLAHRRRPTIGQLCTSSTAKPGHVAGGASAAESGRAQPSSPQKVASFSETLSKWVWRGLLTASGAGVAGAGALYVTDPTGTREMAQAFVKEIDERIKFFTEPSREELLPDPVPPFPGAVPWRTLVIDLDVLVHSSYNRQFGWRVAKRPGADAFLAYMSSFYEIVVFTSGLNSYADPILNQLDPNKYHIAYRLYRTETKYEGGVHVKDLSHLNRDLSRVILVDHDPKHFKRQPENALLVPNWSDDPADTALLDLVPFLEGLVQEDVPDVRDDLTTLRGKPLSDGLAEHRALASSRSGRVGGGRSGLFGAAAAPAAGQAAAAPAADAPIEGSGTDDATAGDNALGNSMWGRVSSKSGSLFRPSGTHAAVTAQNEDEP